MRYQHGIENLVVEGEDVDSKFKAADFFRKLWHSRHSDPLLRIFLVCDINPLWTRKHYVKSTGLALDIVESYILLRRPSVTL